MANKVSEEEFMKRFKKHGCNDKTDAFGEIQFAGRTASASRSTARVM